MEKLTIVRQIETMYLGRTWKLILHFNPINFVKLTNIKVTSELSYAKNDFSLLG